MVDSASKQAITNEQDKHFDYDLVQIKYLTACSVFFSEPKNLTGPWTQAVRRDAIDYIKKGKGASLTVKNIDTKLLSFCQPVLDNNEYKLIIKGSATEILCYEECFDVFVDFHKMTDHGDFKAMQALLIDNFYIHKKCLEYFLESCNVCNKFSKIVDPVAFNDHVVVEIHKAPHPDENCHYVLYYMDLATKFKLFKPLLSFSEDEVAVEMLKIFTDFGPPHQLETVYIEFFTKVLSIIEQGGVKYSIPLYESKQIIGEPIIKDEVPKSAHWATMCQLIQYNHNNNKDGTNPMEKIFYTNDSKTYYSEKLNQVNIQQNIDGITEDASGNLILNQVETEMLPMETETCKAEHEEAENTCEAENTAMSVDDNYVLVNTNITDNTTDNVIVKEEVTIEETTLIRPVQNIKESPVLKADEKNINEEIIITDLTEHANTIIPDLTKVSCSVCNGKMITDFFCFYCKNPTHIFCMKRVIDPVTNSTGPIVTNTYCQACYDFLQLSLTEK